MRALRDGFHRAIFAQSFDVLLRERLEEVFVPQPARRVAVARLFLAENAERHAGLLQYLDQRARDFLLPLVERPRAADEEEILMVLRGFLHRGGRRHVEVRAPFGAAVGTHAPGGALVFHPSEDAGRPFRKAALPQDEAAPHVDDARQMLDEDRTSLLPPAPGGAGPEGPAGH